MYLIDTRRAKRPSRPGVYFRTTLPFTAGNLRQSGAQEREPLIEGGVARGERDTEAFGTRMLVCSRIFLRDIHQDRFSVGGCRRFPTRLITIFPVASALRAAFLVRTLPTWTTAD